MDKRIPSLGTGGATLNPDEPLVVEGPPRWQGWGVVGVAALLLLALAREDGGGRVLTLPVIALLLLLGARDLLLRPVLVADRDEVTVVSGRHRRHAPWAEVERMRVVKDRRTPLLELDLGDGVIVLSARQLGRHPDEVLEDLARLSPSGS